MVTMLTVDKKGRVTIPNEVLEDMGISAGAKLIMRRISNSLFLMPADRMQDLVDAFKRGLEKKLGELGEDDLFFGGLTVKEYFGLSEEEKDAIWDELYKEAESEESEDEMDVPADFMPIGQKRC